MTLFSILGNVVMSGAVVIAVAALAGYALQWMDTAWAVPGFIKPVSTPP